MTTNINVEKRVMSVSYGVNKFKELKANDNCIVLIVNSYTPSIIIMDVSGLNKEETKYLVDTELDLITRGCNIKYEVVNKVGNCYFCD